MPCNIHVHIFRMMMRTTTTMQLHQNMLNNLAGFEAMQRKMHIILVQLSIWYGPVGTWISWSFKLNSLKSICYLVWLEHMQCMWHWREAAASTSSTDTSSTDTSLYRLFQTLWIHWLSLMFYFMQVKPIALYLGMRICVCIWCLGACSLIDFIKCQRLKGIIWGQC